MKTRRFLLWLCTIGVFLLVLQQPMKSAIAFVQGLASTTNGAAATFSAAFGGNVTSGNLLVAGGSAWNSAAAPAAITVSGTGAGCSGLSFTVVLGTIPAGMTWRTFLAYAVATGTGACTVVVDPDVTADGSFSIAEFSGQHATVLDVNGGTTPDVAGNTTISDTITTVAANALIVGVFSHDDGSAITPGINYTQVGEQESGASNQPHNMVYRLVTTATTYTVDWTQAVAVPASAQTLSFAPSTGGGGPTPIFRGLPLVGVGGDAK